MENWMIIPFLAVLGPVAIVLLVLRHRRQQTEARYRTLLQLADKGADLPAALLAEPAPGGSELRRALVLASGGLGLMLTLLALPLRLDDGQAVGALWGLGLLPLMLGLGYLASWWLGRRAAAHA